MERPTTQGKYVGIRDTIIFFCFFPMWCATGCVAVRSGPPRTNISSSFHLSLSCGRRLLLSHRSCEILTHPWPPPPLPPPLLVLPLWFGIWSGESPGERRGEGGGKPGKEGGRQPGGIEERLFFLPRPGAIVAPPPPPPDTKGSRVVTFPFRQFSFTTLASAKKRLF